jgi:beta-lactamase regulating signal transducer with metallopeptidase domain
MSIFDQVSRQWLAWMLSGSWQLALLVCIVAVVTHVAQAASARLRYGLWLLVLAKVFLPPGLETPLSVGRWAVAPLLATTGLSPTVTDASLPFGLLASETPADAPEQAGPPSVANRASTLPALLMGAWAAGGGLFWAMVGWRYARVTRVSRSARSIDEGPVRIALEQIAIDLKLRSVPDLLSTEAVTSPFLFGVIRPRIVLPEMLLGQLNDNELQAVLTHELVHWKRHDTWVGWLQVLAQSIFWFHPFLWWANRQLRHERECVCDATVLRLGRVTPQHYGESIFRVLAASRGRSFVAGSLVGVFERGAKLQNRLEDIMNYEPIQREATWARRFALAAFAILFLPMAPGLVRTQLAKAQQDNSTASATEAAEKPYPQIVKTIPQPGATKVDPALKEISVTFDRDMGQGMSWTGGPPLFPPIDESRQARWTDARTCVLPVKLQKGAYYRLGVNSTGYQNFRGSDGVPVPPSVIYFTTTDAVERRVRAPKIVAIHPENGAMDVDPENQALRVTFDMPMEGGMSWTGGGPHYPGSSPDGKKASWSKDAKTCTLPVVLESGHDYQLGLNSLSHINFQSKWGVPLAPVVYKFRTRAAKK